MDETLIQKKVMLHLANIPNIRSIIFGKPSDSVYVRFHISMFETHLEIFELKKGEEIEAVSTTYNGNDVALKAFGTLEDVFTDIKRTIGMNIPHLDIKDEITPEDFENVCLENDCLKADKKKLLETISQLTLKHTEEIDKLHERITNLGEHNGENISFAVFHREQELEKEYETMKTENDSLKNKQQTAKELLSQIKSEVLTDQYEGHNIEGRDVNYACQMIERVLNLLTI